MLPKPSPHLVSLLGNFSAPVRYAFAYGSGVFAQANASSGKMVDLVFAVDDPGSWHRTNMAQHPMHYSFAARTFGTSPVQTTGARVYYNPYVELDGTLVKYGVVGTRDLCDDLENWTTLYLAGRMHKPIATLAADETQKVEKAQEANLLSALRVALLRLPETFTPRDLWLAIAALSYTGDPRMDLPGENANKVANIVDAQSHLFAHTYQSLLPKVHIHLNSRIKQDTALHPSFATQLPAALAGRIQTHVNSADWASKTQQNKFKNALTAALTETVRAPAWRQSINGLYTAGFTRSARYLFAKLGKVRLQLDAHEHVLAD